MPSRYANTVEIRRRDMIQLLRKNGPMTVAELCAQIGCGEQSIRNELALNDEVLFERVDEQKRGKVMGSLPGKFYLTASALGTSEDEFEHLADNLFSDDGDWFPKADPLLVQTINAMVRIRAGSSTEAA